MKQQIEAILAEAKAKGLDCGSEQMGDLWCIWVGSHGGGRKDGVGLARELVGLALAKKIKPAPEMPAPKPAKPAPVSEDIPVQIPDFLKEPEDPRLEQQAAEIAALRAQIAERDAKAAQAVNTPPADIADLIETADTPAETNEKLLARLREVLGLIGLAEDAGGRAAPDLYRKRDRLESGIRWNRGRSAEQL